MKIPFQYFLLLSSQAIAGTGKTGDFHIENEKKNSGRPNVLFIFVDDLRPELGCYGNKIIKTPNLDRLASQGYLFKKQYCNVPTSGASRCCLLTGMYPRSSSYLSNEAIRNHISGKPESDIPETFVHLLKRNNYHTIGIGKISHYADGLLYGYNEPVGTQRELPYSWDEFLFDHGKWGTGWNAFFGYADGTNRQGMKNNVKPYEKGITDDEGYPDGLTAKLAVEKLRELAHSGKPFFLGVGFFKPHLPFTAPAKYWDLYDEGSIPLTPSPGIPENINIASLHQSSEFNGYRAGDENATLSKPLTDDYARKIKHAYFACVSYIDTQIGKLLDELEETGLDKNTIIVIWGDHGWHLGDQRVWGKHTLFERSLQSALIIKMPGENKGKEINRIVSSVDIYPTLMEMCKVPMPVMTDGKSMVSLIKNPSDPKWHELSFGYYNNGISMRNERYRLSRYFRKTGPETELYDLKADPNETRNIAAERPELVKELMTEWEKGNTGLYQK